MSKLRKKNIERGRRNPNHSLLNLVDLMGLKETQMTSKNMNQLKKKPRRFF
jgi:hypothetical protein